MLKVLMSIVMIWIVTLCASGQRDTSTASYMQVSILTCGSGEELYALFGHSAIRVRDDLRDIDVVYNYGTGDFNAPGFVFRFLRGQLDYLVTRTTMESFMREYLHDQRHVKEQILDISYAQQVALFGALETNIRRENRRYKYDFFYDNCVTRIRDKTTAVLGPIEYGTLRDADYSYRDLLHTHLEQHAWTSFGMDLILGVDTDQVAGQLGQMFLPSYYHSYLSEARLDGRPLIASEETLLEFSHVPPKPWFWTPFRFFGCLFVLELIGFFLHYITGDRHFMVTYDKMWFGLLSISFLIMAFMWWATDHEVCRNNYNLLWTVPWTVLAYFFTRRVKKLLFFLTISVSLFLLLTWSINPQNMPPAIMFIILISLIKSLRGCGFIRWINRLNRARSWTMLVVILVMSMQLTGQSKISGITVVAPREPFVADPMKEVVAVHAQWIALVPYGMSRLNEPQVRWGSSGQWWGERVEGIERSIQLAQKNGLKIMLKPQVWVYRGWVGDMDFDTEEEWKIWEESYYEYIMYHAELAQRMGVEMLCVGTEYRISVKKREAFWRKLIRDVRAQYDGLLTYSSNWDSYSQVPFWDQLDYIGLSAYFPLSEMDTPLVMVLDYHWNKYVNKLKKFSHKHNKQILFTEYGYLSVDGAGGKTWELEQNIKERRINERAQANCIDALMSEFKDKDFWAGGFLWKWFPEGQGHEGYPERDYTPQGKMAEKVLARHHSAMNQSK